MPSKDPEVRHLVAVLAANARHAGTEYPHTRPTAPIPSIAAEVLASYEREVDPSSQLPADVRRKRALAAFRRDEAYRALARRRPDGDAA